MMHAGATHIFAIQDGRADVELQKGCATWRFSPSKLAEVLEKLDAMKASPGPCHHYVDVSSPAETLVLSRDAYVSRFKDLDRWGCLLRGVSDRVAPVIGPPRPPPCLPATGQLPDLGSMPALSAPHG